MSTLTFEKMSIPGSHLGKDGNYPILYKQKMFEKTSILDESEGLYINYGNILHMLPYTSQDDYDRKNENQEFDVAVLENDYLKATFVPQLGGRMWSLYDKVNKRDLIINNPVFRPCNFAVRNAWFSGGVEWNCGVRGHSALTCSPIFAAKTKLDDGTPVLRLYAFERIRANTFQMEFFLKDHLPFLFARMRMVNGSTEVKPVYWWSTIAVKQEEGARVIVPANEAYINQDEDPVYKMNIPVVDGVDLSYPTNHSIVVDHFYNIPDGQRKYEAYVRPNGQGIIHASTRRLKGRKLFVWGTSVGGDNWQKFLTGGTGYDQPYLEIQAGLAPTQNESLPMPPQSAWEWLEAYGAVDFEPSRVHGEWETSKQTVQKWLDEVLPEETMDELLTSTYKMATSPADVVMKGQGWGALDNAIQESLGRKPIAEYLDFGALEEQQNVWMRFLKNGYLDCPDPKAAPASFIVQNEWFELLKKAVKAADANNWYAWYNIGLCYFARSLYEEALEAFEKSMALEQSTWGYHGLANVWRVMGDERLSAYLMAKARSLNPSDLALAKETLRFAYEAGEYDLMNSVYDELSAEQRKAPMIKAYHAFALAHTGRPDDALEILEENGGLEIPDLREGDNSLPNEFIFCKQAIAAREGRTLRAEEIEVPEKIDFRMFFARKK